MLKDKISQYTKDMMDKWEATEQIIDDTKAFYMLKDPDSKYQKVCMFRDGEHFTIYGDYGSYTFDQMTWYATPQNLKYDNLGYQLEKMSSNNRQNVFIFKEKQCIQDLLDWVVERCETRFNLDVTDQMLQDFRQYVRDNWSRIDKEEAVEFLTPYHLFPDATDEIADILTFAGDAMWHTEDQSEWERFLYDRYDDLSNFDEITECELWKAGQKLSDRFLVSLYAMQVCGEKLDEQKERIQAKHKEKSESIDKFTVSALEELFTGVPKDTEIEINSIYTEEGEWETSPVCEMHYDANRKKFFITPTYVENNYIEEQEAEYDEISGRE